MAEGAIFALLVLAVGAFWLSVSAASAAKRKTTLDTLAGMIGGDAVATATGVTGTYQDVKVALEYGSRGSGSHRESWTFIEGVLPVAYPFTLTIRKHESIDGGAIARGEMVDVLVGDLRFDSEFLVEGAPAEVVRSLLGDHLQTWFVQRSRADLVSVDGKLRLAIPGWALSPEGMLEALAIVTSIAGGVRAAHLALDRAVVLPQIGEAFRAIPDDRPLQEARAARAAEVEAVKAKQAARVAASGLGVIVLGVILLIMLLSSR